MICWSYHRAGYNLALVTASSPRCPLTSNSHDVQLVPSVRKPTSPSTVPSSSPNQNTLVC